MNARLADLHRHLDGSLRPSTVRELARFVGIEVPEALRFTPGMGLEAALARFAFTLSLLQEPDHVARVAAEMCEDALADGVETLEVRFAPQLHADTSEGMARIVDAALEGLAGRAGLVLCLLYGESPELGERLVSMGARPGVVGLDLAGGPVPGHRWGLADYAEVFAKARRADLGRTVHASEGRPPAEIQIAIERLGAQRIGHGTTLLEDARVLELVLEREITIEACPTSNWQVGVISSVAEHPLPKWLELGVRVCVNTDNTLFSDITSSEEHRRVAAIPGVSPEGLARVIATGHHAAFGR